MDHILAGNMESACRLLHDQVGVVNFQAYTTHFMASYSRYIIHTVI
jgi:coatomer protein complex subunit alpha (xenin)